MTRDSPYPPSPPETPESILSSEEYQDTNLNVRKDAQQAFESFPGPPTTIQSDVDVNVPLTVTASTPLSLQCMMCNASPTVGSRPTVTMCGHLFCSVYVSRILGTTVAGLTLH